jgi:hypothetical protein
MRRSSPRSWPSSRAALLAVAALAGGACTGTPLPEPPDELPRPDWDVREVGPASVMAGDASRMRVTLRSERAAVKPDTTVWAINLDSPPAAQEGPSQIMANADGGFAIGVLVASGDRVRIVSRTPTKHSPPLDLMVTLPGPGLEPLVARAPSITLACLKLTPAETLVLDATSGTITLDNQCSVPVSITRAELRLGDQGMSLGAAPTEIAAGTKTTLTFSDSVGPGVTERLDILLLDVTANGVGNGRYAIDLFSDLE